MIHSFKDLRVWQVAHRLTLEIYKVTNLFPDKEKFGIISQIRRSSSSVGANIVEGHSRKSTKEFIQFLFQARGSLAETVYFIILATDLGYLKKDKSDYLQQHYELLGKQLNALITSLKNKT
ncbi:four helix bundle protein [Candidatus Roizmanbacteria bacterium CG_4_10_14_0_8_um_filter_33_9]|uniref:Four helix bundle protein n=1 Tax=Candidatus Roizmanbacteria bacterium CG_4_10_14_0_8_um_filter_33_9 TaxID=1974826 RepID=A0A2M7QI77_9BACT|nr:MAG: four helix bundle protein [Candidatus Roizmanbacteria bacterium CG_4_10_14_0_8_um_filter_33_9]